MLNKPSSVPQSGDDHLSRPVITRRLQRHNPEGSAGRFIPPLFGLAPNGVYLAGRLPDRWCALTAPFHPYLHSRRYTFLWHYPWGHPRRTLSGILPCGARTFLIWLKASRDHLSYSTVDFSIFIPLSQYQRLQYYCRRHNLNEAETKLSPTANCRLTHVSRQSHKRFIQLSQV